MSSPDSDSSDSDEPRSDTQDLKNELLNQICRIKSTGSFAAFEIIDNFVNPGISVDSQNSIRLPLSAEDAQFLIRMSHQAPFGLGTETLVDESVRKTLQIDACKIQFLNEKWPCYLNRVTKKVATKLGVAGAANVKAEFHKMLIYEKGAMFKAHRDTEKIPGMFGTLVICLPSPHTGGTVHLQHGNKTAQFATSEFSTFDASFITWYADVTHEIKPVESGYRWVLVYNLVHVDRNINLSARTLTARVQDFRCTLEQWQNLSDQPAYLVYPLAHQYTQEGLKLARLKGEDYCRASHVAQSCAEHGAFQVLLANMELCVTDRQEDGEEVSELYLTRIVDLGGFNLSIHNTRPIAEAALLENVHHDRDPDVQRGGGFLGNQHLAIDQFFKDSVLVIVPDRSLESFLLGRNPSHIAFDHLMGKLRESVSVGGELKAMQLLLQICHDVVNDTYQDFRERDLDLGPVAASAIFLRNSFLFAEAVKGMTAGYNSCCYATFGEMIDLQDFVVSEDDIVEALTKSGKLYKTISNLQSLRSGFVHGNADREDASQSRLLQHWLDSIAFDSFVKVPSASTEDASSLIAFIAEHEDRPFNQFVLYQGARQFIDRFSSNATFTIPFTIDALESISSRPCVSSLMDRLLKPVVSHFDLQIYASYAMKRSGQDGGASNPAGPITSLYARTKAQDSGLTTILLTRIQTQISNLAQTDYQTFVLPFLSNLLTVLDTSSSVARECVYALLTTYVLRTVGHEPEKPKDWSRPDEIQQCRQDCEICPHVNNFLRNPEKESDTLPFKIDYHLPRRFKYIDIRPAALDNHLMVTKTLKHWERECQQWQSHADNTVREIEKLPSEKLRECLPQRLEEILNLKIVKIATPSTRRDTIA